MKGINRVLLVGNLTRDPELTHTKGGTAVAKFGLAVNSREKDENDEWGDRADFFDVTVFGHQADAVDEYLVKGRPAAVDGRLRQDRWQDKDSGGNRSKIVVIADNVQFLPHGQNGGGAGRHEESQAPPDDVPFSPPDDEIPY